MKQKVKMLVYDCKICKNRVYYKLTEKFEEKCKVCGNEMIFSHSFNYNPDNGLKAIKQLKNKNESFNMPIVECPYWHSTNTKKITDTSKIFHTVMFGIFSMSRNNKQWHCNRCKSDF